MSKLIVQPDPHQAAYDRVCAEVTKARDDAGKWRGACIDCKFYRKPAYGIDGVCLNPLVGTYTTNELTGEITHDAPVLIRSYDRDDPKAFVRIPRLCGEERVLFTPAVEPVDPSVKRGLLQKLFG